MTLEELADAGPESDYQPPVVRHPAGWEPGVAWDGHAGTLTTAPLDSAPEDWADSVDHQERSASLHAGFRDR